MYNHHEAIGACAVGQYPYPYPAAPVPVAPPPYGYAPPPYGYGMAPFAGPMSWEIVGQPPPPAPDQPAEQSWWDKTVAFGKEKTLGVENRWWGLAAVTIGGVWALYYSGALGRDPYGYDLDY